MNAQEYATLVDEYAQGFDRLKAAAQEIPPEAWSFNPAPREWSVRELVCHMADSEMLGATRLYMIIAQPGSTLMSYDDDKWSRALSYTERDATEALETFRLVRRTNSDILRRQPEASLENSVIHPDNPYPEYGDTFDLEKWLRIYTRHVRDHLEQLRSIHEAWMGRAAAG